jgi:hypothetical protein
MLITGINNTGDKIFETGSFSYFIEIERGGGMLVMR